MMNTTESIFLGDFNDVDRGWKTVAMTLQTAADTIVPPTGSGIASTASFHGITNFSTVGRA